MSNEMSAKPERAVAGTATSAQANIIDGAQGGNGNINAGVKKSQQTTGAVTVTSSSAKASTPRSKKSTESKPVSAFRIPKKGAGKQLAPIFRGRVRAGGGANPKLCSVGKTKTTNRDNPRSQSSNQGVSTPISGEKTTLPIHGAVTTASVSHLTPTMATSWADEVDREKAQDSLAATTASSSHPVASQGRGHRPFWDMLSEQRRAELLAAGLRREVVERRRQENKCVGCGATSHQLAGCTGLKIPGRSELVPRQATVTPRAGKRPHSQTPTGVTPPVKVVKASSVTDGMTSYAAATKQGRTAPVVRAQTTRSKYVIWVTHPDNVITGLTTTEFEDLMRDLTLRGLEEEHLPLVNGHWHKGNRSGFFTDDEDTKLFLEKHIQELGFKPWRPEELAEAREPTVVLTGYLRKVTGGLRDDQLQRLIGRQLQQQNLTGATVQRLERIKSGGVLIFMRVTESCCCQWQCMSPPLHLRVGMEGYVRFITRDEWKQLKLAGKEQSEKVVQAGALETGRSQQPESGREEGGVPKPTDQPVPCPTPVVVAKVTTAPDPFQQVDTQTAQEMECSEAVNEDLGALFEEHFGSQAGLL